MGKLGSSYEASSLEGHLVQSVSGSYTKMPIKEIEVFQVSKNKGKEETTQKRSEDDNPIDIDGINSAIITNGNPLLALNRKYNTWRIVLMMNNPSLHHLQAGKLRILYPLMLAELRW